MEQKDLLEKLNKFTRRELSGDEVYIFTVTLCDNEVDRDNERFSRKSLDEMSEKFIGVTGIFDHDPKEKIKPHGFFIPRWSRRGKRIRQGKLRIFKRLRLHGEDCVKCRPYQRNRRWNKKEVSVSCSAEKQICAICGADRRERACRHIKGRRYDGKKCVVTLDGISDVYEWSFVAVPAQVCAGVTKKSYEEDIHESAADTDDTEKRAELEGKIRKALMLKNADGNAAEIFNAVKDKLEIPELEELGKTLCIGRLPKDYCADDNSAYMM